MSFRSEKELLDIVKWYEEHKKTISDPMKKVEFLQKLCENMMHEFINLLEDVKILEGRGTIGKNFPNIIVPSGVSLKRQSREEEDEPSDAGIAAMKISPAAGAVQTPKFNPDGKEVGKS